MSNDESNIGLWAKRRHPGTLKRGSYIDLRERLLESLAKAQSLKLLKKAAGNTYTYTTTAYVLGESTVVEVEADLKAKPKKLHVAVSVGTGHDSDVRYYDLNDSGYAVDFVGLNVEDEDWPNLRAGICAVLSDLESKVNQQTYRRQERQREMKKKLLICVALFLFAILVFFCIRWWWFEPLEADNRARKTYNAENHQLDSSGYPVDAHPLAIVPSGTLQAMPSYGGDDTTLAYPRETSISYTESKGWCTNLTVDIPIDTTLVVAAEENSPFIHDRYLASYTNRTLNVCLVDGFMKEEASHKITANLALQAKPQGKTN